MDQQTDEDTLIIATTDTAPNATTDSAPQKSTIIWAILSLIVAIFFVTNNTSPIVLGAGFFMKSLACLVGALTGWIGALLGDAIRKFAAPDAMFTSGGMGSIIKMKLFWLIGPQLVGLIFGALLGITLVLN